MKRQLAFILFMAYCLPHYSQQTMGLFFNNEGSMNGYTLFSNNEFTYLIDNCGFVVNEWESEYKCNNGLFITSEGKLIRQGQDSEINLFGGVGGLIERFDWHGNLEWTFTIANETLFVAHHDIELMPNGNILLTVWERLSADRAEQEGRTMSGFFYNEQIWEIEPMPNNQADIVWRWSAIDHIIQDVHASKSNFGNVSEHPELIDINYITSELDQSADWLHFNSIDYNAELDQIVVSSRNTSEVYIIDHSTTTTQAASGTGGKYGKGGDILYRHGNHEAHNNGSESDRQFYQPHDVNWLENEEFHNDFIIFNNEYIPNTRSRIEIWNNPADGGFYQFSNENLYGEDDLLWSYEAPGFYSSIMSSAQFLPNGNILTTEGTSGEITEIVTSNKEKVWKYINPVNRNGGPGIQSGTPRFNSLFRSTRYPQNYEGFENFNLIPGDPVELLPDDIGCEIHTMTSSDDADSDRLQSQYYISMGFLICKDDYIPKGFISIYDITGQLCMKFKINSVGEHLDITRLNSGFYILKSKNIEPKMFYKH